MYRGLAAGESVHLADFPKGDAAYINIQLENAMEHMRGLAEAARSVRAQEGIKLRYPLATAVVVSNADITELAELLKSEINVKEVTFADSLDAFLTQAVKPNFSSLGPKFKEKAGDVAAQIAAATPDEVASMTVTVDDTEVAIDENDYVLEQTEKEGFAIGESDEDVIVLDTRQTPALLAEGFARELIRRIQEMRKDMNLGMGERIVTTVDINTKRVMGWEKYIQQETRSTRLRFGEVSIGTIKEWHIGGEVITIGIDRADAA
jgi:isoleucyl-tRNA synthetase